MFVFYIALEFFSVLVFWRGSVVGVRLRHQLQLAPIPSAQLWTFPRVILYFLYSQICVFVYFYLSVIVLSKLAHSVYPALDFPRAILYFLYSQIFVFVQLYLSVFVSSKHFHSACPALDFPTYMFVYAEFCFYAIMFVCI